LDVTAKITGIKYTPLTCRDLDTIALADLENGLPHKGSFLLQVSSKSQIAMSWWTSSKRTRTYPYARVYDTLNFQGRKVTIIPIFKDEGEDGDRDFLQWDTISLMSLLGVYTIISYYNQASKNSKYKNKITGQHYDYQHLRYEIKKLCSYQSDALHWNLEQIGNAGKVCQKALDASIKISRKLKVRMHSKSSAEGRIDELLKGKKSFMSFSRKLAKEAQKRESLTNQPKEKLTGSKGTLTVSNYLGGNYYLTVDEIEIRGKNILLIEGKHSKKSYLPSMADIKDGFIKLFLLTNLKKVRVDERIYNVKPILKLTSDKILPDLSTNKNLRHKLRQIINEAKANNFNVTLNQNDLANLSIGS
jgi:hypothetical protein